MYCFLKETFYQIHRITLILDNKGNKKYSLKHTSLRQVISNSSTRSTIFKNYCKLALTLMTAHPLSKTFRK
jgi:hypothetical protein